MLLTLVATALPYAEFDLTFWGLAGLVLALVLALLLEQVLVDPDPTPPNNSYEL